ncbi:MAG: CvpA family protein [Bacteroidaceae bacterium]|nr:CvpA family protein [Bacteroidaceae bacterium]
MYIDLFVCAVLLWALYNGWRQGLLRELVSALGWLVGLLVAATCYSFIGDYLVVEGSETNQFTSIAAFLLLWIAVPIFLGFVATLITKAVKNKAIGIPNAVLGALVSAVKFIILLSCAFNVMNALHIIGRERTEESCLFQPVCQVLTVFFDNDDAASTSPTPDSSNGDTIWVDMSAPTQSADKSH